MKTETITVDECCEWLNVSRNTLGRWRNEGLPFIKVNRSIRFNKSDVYAWMKKNTDVEKFRGLHDVAEYAVDEEYVRSRDYLEAVAKAILPVVGQVFYFTKENGDLAFAVETDRLSTIQELSSSISGIPAIQYSLDVYIESNSLMFCVIDRSSGFAYSFGIADRDVIRERLVDLNHLNFYIYFDNNSFETAYIPIALSGRAKTVISSFAEGTYPDEVSLTDKFGKNYMYETVLEAQMSYVAGALDGVDIKNGKDIAKLVTNEFGKESNNRTGEFLEKAVQYVSKYFFISPRRKGFSVREIGSNAGLCISDEAMKADK